MFTQKTYEEDGFFSSLTGFTHLIWENWTIIALFLLFLFPIIALLVLFFIVNSTQKTPSYSKDSSNTLSVVESKITFDVSGAVKAPGVYTADTGITLSQGLALAGGLSEESSYEWVSKVLNLAGEIKPSQKIYIPYDSEITPDMILEINDKVFGGLISSITQPSLDELLNQHDTSAIQSTSSVSADSSSRVTDELQPQEHNLLDINAASIAELEDLPGIGKIYAQKIFTSRPIKDESDLISRVGLSRSLVSKISKLISY